MENNAIKLRPTTIQDAELLLEWRNDPETRRMSHSAAEVQREEHISWLTKALNNPNRRLFISEENGIPVGRVRADLLDGVYELSWTVAPGMREYDVGKEMVALLAGRIRGLISAEIKIGNAASSRIAEHIGMELEREAEGIQYWARKGLT